MASKFASFSDGRRFLSDNIGSWLRCSWTNQSASTVAVAVAVGDRVRIVLPPKAIAKFTRATAR